VFLANNVLFGNPGGVTNGGVVWGTGNSTTDPMLDTVTSFTITSRSSPAVDMGRIRPVMADQYFGNAPDIGWKESLFVRPYYSWLNNYTSSPRIVNDWQEIRGTGTLIAGSVALDDDASFLVNLGFNVGFYGNSYNQAYLTSNGLLEFGAASTVYNNTALPSPAPDNFVAGFWDDLLPSANTGSGAYYQVFGTAPNRRIVIECYNFPHISDTTNGITFEYVLFENSDDVIVRYLDPSFGNPVNDYGISATAGVENTGGADYLQYSFNTAVITNKTAIYYGSGRTPMLVFRGENSPNQSLRSNAKDIPLLQFKLVATAGKTVVVNRMAFTNLGSSASALPLDMKASLYIDVNQNGLLDAGDAPVKTNLAPTMNEFVFTNLAYAVSSGTAQYFLLVSDFSNARFGEGYLAELRGEKIQAQTNGFACSILNTATGSTQVIAFNTGPFYVDDTTGLDTNPGAFVLPFRTIQRAVNAMAGGLPNCTAATAYIFPGTYYEQVQIRSNRNPGLMVVTRLSNAAVLPMLNGLGLSNSGVRITNASRVVVAGLSVGRYAGNGFILAGNSTNNILLNNVVFSNPANGVLLKGNGVRNNQFLGNRIGGSNQNAGINIQDSDANIFRGNQLGQNKMYGVSLTGSAISNQFYENTAVSNKAFGNSGFCMNGAGVFANTFVSNAISGYYGVDITAARQNLLRGNRITRSTSAGISAIGGISNVYVRNQVFSNSTAISFGGGGGKNNTIASNYIAYNTGTGIWFYAHTRNVVGPSNQFIKNSGVAIDFEGTSAAAGCYDNLVSMNLIFSNGGAILIGTSNIQRISVSNNTMIGRGTSSGVSINHGRNNRILVNTIDRYGIGLQVRYTARSNLVSGNSFGTNYQTGVSFQYAGPYFNTVTNNVFRCGALGTNGIRMTAGITNRILGNTILRSFGPGIYVTGTNVALQVVGNTVSSNLGAGYFSDSDASSGLRIYRNVFSANNGAGILLQNPDRTTVSSNRISFNLNPGISIAGSSVSNLVSRNDICSNNGTAGVFITTRPASFNVICSNRIFGPLQTYGVVISSANNTKIFRNLIRHHVSGGITVSATATNTFIINNTLFKNAAEDGILWSNLTSGTMMNNIILSNGNGAGDFGVENAGSGLVVNRNSVLFGNAAGSLGGAVTVLPGVVTIDPMLETLTSYTIASPYSYAVDSGLNVKNEAYSGNGLDAGWKESPFTFVYSGPFFVDDTVGNDSNPGTFSAPFLTVQYAADVMSRGAPYCTVATAFLFPGNYLEQVNVLSNKNPAYMVFTALSNSRYPVIDGDGYNYSEGFTINAQRVMLDRLEIAWHDDCSVILSSASWAVVRNCRLHDNNGGFGVYNGQDDCDSVLIQSNSIWQCGSGSVNVTFGDGWTIRGNSLRGWGGSGISMYNSHSNIVEGNTTTALTYGFLSQDITNVIVRNNVFQSNLGNAVYQNLSSRSVMFSNNDFRRSAALNPTPGILLAGTPNGIRFLNNRIITNLCNGTNFQYGLYITAGSGSNILISGNTFNGSSCALRNDGADFVRITGNLITNTGSGIEINSNFGGGAARTAVSNIILRNTIRGTIGIGGGSSRDVIAWNTVTPRSNSDAIAIVDNYSREIEVRSNRLIGGKAGLAIGGADRVSAVANLMQSQSWVAIYMYTNSGPMGAAQTNSFISNTVIGGAFFLNAGSGHQVLFNGFQNVNAAIALDSVRDSYVNYNTIQSADTGIVFQTGGSNVGITGNIIRMATNAAVYLNGNVCSVVVASNNLSRRSAVKVRGGRDLMVRYNMIGLTNDRAFAIDVGTWGSGIVTNIVLLSNRCSGAGIQVQSGVKGAAIVGNTLSFCPNYTNTTSGSLVVWSVTNFTITGNMIRRGWMGAVIRDSSRGTISGNTFSSNGIGVDVEGWTSNLDVVLNNITGSTLIGLYIATYNGTPSFHFARNNLLGNRTGIGSQLATVDCPSNWWGSSLKSSIKSGLQYYGPSGSASFNFEPYRLWHAYDIRPGSDTTPVSSVTSFTLRSGVSSVTLSWNKVGDADQRQYYVYRSLTADYGQLQHSIDVIGVTSSTNYVDTPGNGYFSYWITTGDDPTPLTDNVLTNESWYSKRLAATVGNPTNVKNISLGTWHWTIQSAAMSAVTGNTLMVYPAGYPQSGSGVYNENVNLSYANGVAAKKLTILSWAWTNSRSKTTVIDGTGGLAAVTVGSDHSVVLTGFKIRNRTWDGVDLANAGRSHVSHNTIYSNGAGVPFSQMPPFGVLISGVMATNNEIVSNEFYANVIDAGIFGSRGNTLSSNRMTGASFESVALIGFSGVNASANSIVNNDIRSGFVGGIGFHGDALNNTIRQNNVTDCSNGIWFEPAGGPSGPTAPGASYNVLEANIVSKGHAGIMVVRNAWLEGNRFAGNTLLSNAYTGVGVESTNFRANTFTSNSTKGGMAGLYLWTAKSNSVLYGRHIGHSFYGLYFGLSTNTVVRGNYCASNQWGLFVTNERGIRANLNSFAKNNIGAFITGVSSADFSKNNLAGNTGWNLAVSPSGPGSGIFTNIWWGTTVWTNIVKVIQNPPSGASSLKAWRLFGPFDIRDGADSTACAPVAGLTAVSAGNSINLTWNHSQDPDTVRYFVYRHLKPDVTNASRAYVVGSVSGAMNTNFVDTPPSNGMWYYVVTALDNPDSVLLTSSLTNESWYAQGVGVSNRYAGPFFVDDTSGSDANPGTFGAPFRTIQRAVNIMSSGLPNCAVATTYVFPGLYNERVIVRSNKNTGYLVVTKLSNTRPVMNGGQAFYTGISLANVSRVAINGLAVTAFTDGISIMNSSSIRLTGSVVRSNLEGGVYLLNVTAATLSGNRSVRNGMDGFLIEGGSLAGQGVILIGNAAATNRRSGIRLINGATNNLIYGNSTVSNVEFGIKLDTGCRMNQVIRNDVSYNVWCGISSSANSNTIMSNRVFNNFQEGIEILGDTGEGDRNTVSFNDIWSNSVQSGNAIDLYSGSRNNKVSYNRIFHNFQNAIVITDSTNNTLSSNRIFANLARGVIIDGASRSNAVIRESIYSNSNDGIYVFGPGAVNNIIRSNAVWGQTIGDGIAVLFGSGNAVVANSIYRFSDSAIYIDEGAVDNLVAGNAVYSNLSSGIYIGWTGAPVKRTIVRGNTVFGNGTEAITVANSAVSNTISANMILNGTGQGFRASYAGRYNSFVSNRVSGSDYLNGIEVTGVTDLLIARNLVRSINFDAVYIRGSSRGIVLANNTIFDSIGARGVSWDNISSGTMVNNILLSNSLEGVIKLPAAGPVVLKNNVFYGNSAPTNGGFVWGPGNSFLDPMIETVTGFTITSALSPAVDTGLVIPGVSASFFSIAPDVGWKESAFIGHFLFAVKQTNYNGYFTGYSNQTVLAIRLWDTWQETLATFRIANLGSLTNGEGRDGISAVKVWMESGTNNNIWSSEDCFVCELYWNQDVSAWTNGNISFATQLGGIGRVLLVTVDLSVQVVESNVFRAVLPDNGISCSGNLSVPTGGLTNSQNRTVPQYLKMPKPAGTDFAGFMGSVAYGDFDSDGDQDVALTGGDAGIFRFIIFRNDNGVLSLAQEPYGANMGLAGSTIAWGDYDNDGDLDIAAAGADNIAWNNRFVIFRNDNGIFNLAQQPMGINNGLYDSSVAFGDIDHDGDLDIALIGNDGLNLRFLIYRNVNGTFSLAQQPIGANLGVSEGSLAFGDVDNDGDPDIALMGTDNIGPNNRFMIYRNDNGVFSLAQEPMGMNLGLHRGSLSFGDFDGDGDLDLASVGESSGALYRFIIWRNTGGMFNLFQEPMGANKGVVSGSIACGDNDNDGDSDIVLTGYDNLTWGRRFAIYRNDGGAFNLSQDPIGANNGFWYSSIACADIDGDGDQDVALSGSDGVKGMFHVYRNLERTFNQPPNQVVSGFSAQDAGGYWLLRWNSSSDDSTPTKNLRYQIAVGTNSGLYHNSTTNIEFPRGQANLGKVTVVTGTPWYQTRITNTKAIYWKVCVIDSAFITSAYSVESVAYPINFGPFFVDDSDGNDSFSGTFRYPFRSIKRAVEAMTPGLPNCTVASAYVFPGAYQEKVQIRSNRNAGWMTIVALSNTRSPFLSGLSSDPVGFKLTNVARVRIQRFTVTGFSNGFRLAGTSISNRLEGNVIRSNSSAGVNLFGDGVRDNSVQSNRISGPNQFYQVLVDGADRNEIRGNRMTRAAGGGGALGLEVQGTAVSNRIVGNYIASNNGNVGIRFDPPATSNLVESNVIRGPGQNFGVMAVGGANRFLRNQVFRNGQYGFYLNSRDNSVMSNTIVSNWTAGVGIGGTGRFNTVASNTLSGPGQSYGVHFINANRNTVRNNLVQYHLQSGFYITGTSSSNRMSGNVILTNAVNGIYSDTDTADWNEYLRNTIGRHPGNGILLSSADRNSIRSNHIVRNTAGGVLLNGSAGTNSIVYNEICSNDGPGVSVNGDAADGNTVVSNQIWGLGQDTGVYALDADYLVIARNLIRDNQMNGIELQGSVAEARILHNTVFGNMDNGLLTGFVTSATLLNNIILSNGDFTGEYGVRNTGSTGLYAAYNLLFGNYDGPTNGGGMVWGSGNIFFNPLLDTVTSYTIVSALSHAVDMGTTNAAYARPYLGRGPDMGWKESSFSRYTNVHNLTLDLWYPTITSAVKESGPGHVIEAYPGVFAESVDLSGRTNLTVRSRDWYFNGINTSTIVYSAGYPYSFQITNARLVKVSGFLMKKGSSEGFHIGGSAVSNTVEHNYVCSNAIWQGIFLDGNRVRQNIILSNEAAGADLIAGVYVTDSDRNYIRGNRIHGTFSYGILLSGTSVSNEVSGNQSYSNNGFTGIYLSGAGVRANLVTGNSVYGPGQGTGISIANAVGNTVSQNRIVLNANYGVRLSGAAASNRITANSIASNSRFGVYSSSNRIIGNEIVSNIIRGPGQMTGVYFFRGTNNLVARNLIRDNSSYGIHLNSLAFGDRILNNTIVRCLTNSGILLANGASCTLANNIILSNGGDLSDYGVKTSAASLVAYNNCVYGNFNGQTNGGGFTWGAGNIFTDPMIDTSGSCQIISAASPSVDNGVILAGVSAVYSGSAPDLGWKESIFTAAPPVLQIRKSVDRSVTKPYEELTYVISYSNASWYAVASGAEIIDVLPGQLMVATNSAEMFNTPHAGGISVWYDTNPSGSAWQNSAFDTPATATSIRRIRWTLDSPIPAGGKGVVRFKVVVK
jgi:uncharacterized repeat protein (TIGR01451 family)